MRYQYLVALHDKLLKAVKLEERLNAIGEDAWELVAVIDDGTHYRLIFKKEVRP